MHSNDNETLCVKIGRGADGVVPDMAAVVTWLFGRRRRRKIILILCRAPYAALMTWY